MIHTLGPEGTFSDKAATLLAQHLGGHQPRRFASDMASVFERTLEEDGAIGVVPIENAIAGTVDVVQDLLALQPIWIEHEIQIPVAFKLLVRGARERIRRVFVHPVAERQCATALTEQLPLAVRVFTDSNTDSAGRLLSTQDESAAVVPVDYREPDEQALGVFALQTAAHNATRFIAFRRASPEPQPDFGKEKLSMVIRPRANRPGVLHEILGVFKRHAMNLTRIESRPSDGLWEYLFFLDAIITSGTPRAWAELRRGDWDVRPLGSYSVLRPR